MRWASCERLRESLEKRTETRPSAAMLEEQTVALDCFMEHGGEPCRDLRLPGDYSNNKQRVPYWARRHVQSWPWETRAQFRMRTEAEWTTLQRMATYYQGNVMAKHARWYGPNGRYRDDRQGLPKWPRATFEGTSLRRHQVKSR